MIRNIFCLFILLQCLLCSVYGQTAPKREFRGAWIHTINQAQYAKMSTTELKKNLVQQLDTLQSCGMNAVLFQVRPEADAWYQSSLEPWSRFLTGKQGKAPEPLWDPMSFMIQECHKRNMEFHAWINPYRVSITGNTNQLSKNHLYFRERWRFVRYGNLILFDPGIPANQDFIVKVVRDIVTRYDVDAIHADDYFYPYPETDSKTKKNIPFPDDASFLQYGKKCGWAANKRDDWRRNNVNTLIERLSQTIHQTKPHVRFGISPFGIYRNKKNTPDGSGSDTNGLENYSALYADVDKWAREGWIDYIIPQIYWEIGHKAADYKTLILNP